MCHLRVYSVYMRQRLFAVSCNIAYKAYRCSTLGYRRLERSSSMSHDMLEKFTRHSIPLRDVRRLSKIMHILIFDGQMFLGGSIRPNTVTYVGRPTPSQFTNINKIVEKLSCDKNFNKIIFYLTLTCNRTTA